MPRSIARLVAAAALSAAWPHAAHADFDPATQYVEAPAVAARYPDPAAAIATPAFAPGKRDFTSQAELEAFVGKLAGASRDLRVRTIGRSQEQRPIPLLVFARPAASSGADVIENGKPTVLIVGQQHGNEPAGAEAALAFAAALADGPGARVLDRVNVLIVPRANPDGAQHFVRGLANGVDLNRDHLLLGTPEGRALGRVFVEYRPDVVLDCHEFGVKTRWLEKFGGLQRHDALIQYATVINLPPALTEAAERMFRRPLVKALEAAGFTQAWYYASSYDMSDRIVSMGGVAPDTGRNVAGLRGAVSFLIETRGVGIGRAHLARRVATHVVAMRSVVDSAADDAAALLALGRRVRQEVAAAAGSGELAVSGAPKTERHVLDLVDPASGADKPVVVDWRSALDIEVRQRRTRPWGYVLAATETKAAARLAELGVTVLRVEGDARVPGERYRVSRLVEAKKDDVRRNDDEGAPSVVTVVAVVEPAEVAVSRGDFYVPLDQPLANVAAAALEPDTQSSYAANRLLTLPGAGAGNAAYLPLARLPAPLSLPAVVHAGDAQP